MSLNDFVVMQKLGSGSFASVYKVRRLIDQQIYALKKIDMRTLGTKQKNNALNQIRLLACFNSPYIIRYCDSFYEQKQDILCIAMQYADNGDLYKKILKHKKQKSHFQQIQIWKIMIHLLYGLNQLHSKNILHRDLKAENVFITNGIYKIGDMNVSKIIKNGQAVTQTGTPYYASPEVWNDMPYDQKSDVWSLGCILYELTMLRPPFEANNMEKLYDNVTKMPTPNIHKTYSKELQNVIFDCLKKSAQKRPSIKQLSQNFTVKIYENLVVDYKPQISEQEKKKLLKTIYMPSLKSQLKNQLPQSNYKNNIYQNSQKKQQQKIVENPSSAKKIQKNLQIQKVVSEKNIKQQLHVVQSQKYVLKELNKCKVQIQNPFSNKEQLALLPSFSTELKQLNSNINKIDLFSHKVDRTKQKQKNKESLYKNLLFMKNNQLSVVVNNNKNTQNLLNLLADNKKSKNSNEKIKKKNSTEKKKASIQKKQKRRQIRSEIKLVQRRSQNDQNILMPKKLDFGQMQIIKDKENIKKNQKQHYQIIFQISKIINFTNKIKFKQLFIAFHKIHHTSRNKQQILVQKRNQQCFKEQLKKQEQVKQKVLQKQQKLTEVEPIKSQKLVLARPRSRSIPRTQRSQSQINNNNQLSNQQPPKLSILKILSSNLLNNQNLFQQKQSISCHKNIHDFYYPNQQQKLQKSYIKKKIFQKSSHSSNKKQISQKQNKQPVKSYKNQLQKCKSITQKKLIQKTKIFQLNSNEKPGHSSNNKLSDLNNKLNKKDLQRKFMKYLNVY